MVMVTMMIIMETIHLYMMGYGYAIENQEVSKAVYQEQPAHCDVLT